jgi:peptidoglycan/LPS O-acetylase OafA/YrhL
VAIEFSLVSLCGSHILAIPVRGLNSFLSNRIARFLADTSYPLYLLHTLVLTLLGGHLFTWSWFLLHGARFRTGLLFITVLTVSYPLAWMLHLAIEIPGIRLGKALLAQRLKGRHDHELVAS